MRHTYVKILGPNLNQAISKLEKLALELEIKKILPVEKGMILSREKHVDYEFTFSWQEEPDLELIIELAHHIDEVIEESNAHYTLQTDFDVPSGKAPVAPAQSFIKIYGPPIGTAFHQLLRLLEKLPEVEAKYLTAITPAVGDYDFVFTWNEKPSQQMVRALVTQLDSIFSKINGMYSFHTVHRIGRRFHRETDKTRLQRLMALEERMKSPGVMGHR
ncbi:MAG: hypothetical protein ACFFC7_02365 [Candidatus Hermodarchaeota archaeon]